MSGIAAVIRLDGGPVDPAAVGRMLERLAARGPDASGAWIEGPVGLGHRMLHDTPESLQDKLPLVARTGDIALTADVRLDNREELLDALGLVSRPPDTVGDAELILQAWQRWGEECPARLLGDFAFAIWDGRHRALFCARDPGGLKPLYYHAGPRVFAAASEVKALLALPEVPRRINELRIAAYLGAGLDLPTDTFFEGVWRLAPGHSLTVTGRPHEPRVFWQLDPTREIRYGSDAAYAEAFRELFTDAVRRRLRSHFPIAAALSGGLDSSSVASVARNLLAAGGAGPLSTYSAVFPTVPACDERAFIDAVVARGGIAPRFVRGDALDPIEDLERMPWHENETLCEPGYYMHWALYRAAVADGVRVFLEGTGGDYVVSHGTGVLLDLARRGRWLALARQAGELGRAFEQPTWRVLRQVASAVAPGGVRRGWQRLRRRGRLWDPILRTEFAQRIRLADRLRAREPAPADLPDGARSLQRRQLTSGLQADIQETQAGLAGAWGVDVRDPFHDRRLVEFCFALPAEQKIRGGRTRVVMRHAMGSILPSEIRDRPGKARLDLMVSRALAVAGRDRLDALMRDARRVLAPYVDPVNLDRVYRRYHERAGQPEVVAVFRIATLTAWLRRVVPAA